MQGYVLALGVFAAASLGLACDGITIDPSVAPAENKGGNCATCHLPEYEGARDHADKKPTTCAICHLETSWHPSEVHHDFWKLTGAHGKAECAFCHKGAPPTFKGTKKDCVSCHTKDFDTSTFPNHETFGTKCADCHSTTAWKPSTHPPPPPRTPDPVAPPIGSSKTAPLGSPRTPLTNGRALPTATPPRVPTSKPPPDVTSRASPPWRR
jgi:hypothetical protein